MTKVRIEWPGEVRLWFTIADNAMCVRAFCHAPVTSKISHTSSVSKKILSLIFINGIIQTPSQSLILVYLSEDKGQRER